VDLVGLRLEKIEQALRDVWRLLKRARSPFYTAKDAEAYDRLKAELDENKQETGKKS
jgi:hypothetical protein